VGAGGKKLPKFTNVWGFCFSAAPHPIPSSPSLSCREGKHIELERNPSPRRRGREGVRFEMLKNSLYHSPYLSLAVFLIGFSTVSSSGERPRCPADRHPRGRGPGAGNLATDRGYPHLFKTTSSGRRGCLPYSVMAGPSPASALFSIPGSGWWRSPNPGALRRLLVPVPLACCWRDAWL
jgi:hypothetical protein